MRTISNKPDILENHKVLNINNLTNIIESKGSYSIEWSKRVGDDASINLISIPSKDLIVLNYSYRSEDIKERIRIDYSPTNYGERPNFRCPKCEDRVRKLYFKNGVFRCRGCHGLIYKSSTLNGIDKVLHKYKKKYLDIQKRLGMNELGLLKGLPEDRPKNMRKDKFQRLKTRGNIIKHLFGKKFKKKYSKITKGYRDRLDDLSTEE